MEETGGSKVSGIRQMGRLKELLQKWQSVTISPKGSSSCNQFLPCNENNNNDAKNGNNDNNNNNNNSNNIHGGISPAICRRLIRSTSSYSESDDDGCGSPDPPFDVPRGYLAVYVGPELRRFIIPTSYLSHQVFKVLLEKVEEEFGFDHSGGLTIPCEIETFKYLLKYMETHQNDPPQDTTDGSTSLTVEE